MADVDLTLGMDATGALRSIRHFSQQASEDVSKVTEAMEGLKVILEVLAVVEIFHGIVEGIKDVTQEAAASQKAMNQLAGAMRATGDYSERNVKAFKEFADGMSEVSKYDDDVIIGQLTIAKQFNTTNQEATKLVKAAADLSAVTGIDLNTATQLLGRSLDGTAGKLNEMIPEVRGLTAEQLVHGAAIDLVAKKYNGFSQSELKTFGGLMESAIRNFNDFKKAIGNVIINNEAVLATITAIAGAFRELQKSVDGNRSSISLFITNGVGLFAETVGITAQMLRALQETFEILFIDVTAFFAKLNAIPQQILAVLSGKFAEAKAIQDTLRAAVKSDTDSALGRLSAYDKVTELAAGLSVAVDKIREKQMSVNEAVKETEKGFGKEKTAVGRVSAELLNQYRQIIDQTKTMSDTRLGQLEKEHDKQIKVITDYTRHHREKEAEALAAIQVIDKKYHAERRAELQKDRDAQIAGAEEDFRKQQERLQKLVANPLGDIFSGSNLTGLTDATRNAVAIGLGSVSQILNGKQGAQNLLSGMAEQLGQAFLGVPGMGALFNALAQGPDKVREMVTQFAEAVPDIIQAVVDSIPAIIDALADKLSDPAYLEKLARTFVFLGERIATSVAIALGKALLKIGDAFVRAVGQFLNPVINGALQFASKILEGAIHFVEKILEGAGQFIDKVVQGIGEALGKLNPFGSSGPLHVGGSGGGLLRSIPIIGGLFAEGGQVPDGYPNDSYPARLTSGEVVVPKDKAQNFKELMGSSGNDSLADKLDQVVKILTAMHMTPNPVQIGHRQFAQAMVDVQRYGLRTTP